MKVSIIGGGGRVGSDAAFCLQLGGIVTEIALVDMNKEMAAGEALDLMHGSALTASQKIYSGDYDAVNGSNCVVITAGLRRKPDETRLELLNRNAVLFKEILKSVSECKLAADASILVVSNPVDILTQIAAESGIVPQQRVLGLGTVLDTCRFRSLLAENLGVGAGDVHALILGEHGDSIFERTKKSGAEVISMKGGAGRAVGVSIMDVVHAIALDNGALMPVSSVQNGKLGISGVALSLPTQVGRGGALNVLEPACTEAELDSLHKSAEKLRSEREKVQ